MGLGSTTKKIQMMADKAEQLYAQLNEVKKQLEDLRVKVDTTHDTVSDLEVKHEQNRAILEALAEERGIDVEKVITEASIEDAEGSEEPDPIPNEAAESGDAPGEPDEHAGTTGDDAAGTETS
ncbi:hypothetical protein HAPAU_24120 [Halalkalicoccus paucihalophilus]|uniref:Chromosome partition protein Smc n=1 Tax=Halalkalicoccus paucihalophilus TaxID=1008153 RepID=A0A151ADR3_9EURY|nr:DUF5798 family protein [Halalkalicoccus paucihalophilus]KYH25734.1 hypothetical protein HAPAU_24120 [Halalkalicoccus paucihalophilus]